MLINIYLPKNRLLTGTLSVNEPIFQQAHATVVTTYTRALGPLKCLGRADQYLATKAGNLTRDPFLPCGDTPPGTFTGTVVPPGSSLRSYGPHPRILLSPNPKGRSGIMIHGGAPGNSGGLRPTEGCVRVSNTDMLEILKLVGSVCEVTIYAS